MGNKRNAIVDMTRVGAAVGIILCHVDLSGYGPFGVLCNQFLSVRFSLMFFLAVMGYYVEKSCQAGGNPIPGRVLSLIRLYGVWSLIYVGLSFLLVVLIGKAPLGQFLAGKGLDFLFSGTYYHFWFYPAAIYSLLFIGGVKRLLGRRAMKLLVPLAAALYAVGLLGTGYLPLGRQIPGLCTLYGAQSFETLMHICFLGFPSIVFGMAAAHQSRKCSGAVLMLAAGAYVAESVLLCMGLGWREDPQMLVTTPLLTVLFLQWAQNSSLAGKRINHSLLRAVSAGMYNVHPLFLAVFAIILPGLNGLGTFLLCVGCAAIFGWVLYCLRKVKLFGLFL